MNKTELIHNLVKVLEQLERYLVFTVFYNYEKFSASNSFCPAFDFEGYYYEIQYDNSLELQVLRWYSDSHNDSEGYVLTETEIEELSKDLAISWAEYQLDNLDEYRFRYEKDKSLIYDSETNKDICVCYDPVNTELLVKLLNEYYERNN